MMSTFQVIHSSGSTNFDQYLYGAVYCNATATITLNGESVECVAGETIPVTVHPSGTTLTADFLLLGNAKPIVATTGANTGNTYTYIDIRTGLPITDSCCR